MKILRGKKSLFVSLTVLLIVATVCTAVFATWGAITDMPSGRHIAGTTTAPDNRVYVLGGRDSLYNITRTGQRFDPSTNSWGYISNMSFDRCDLAAASLPFPNRVYAVGGTNGQVFVAPIEEYNVASNTWTTRAPMLMPRVRLAAVGYNGLVYAVGGMNFQGTITGFFEVYNPGTNVWTRLPDMPTPRICLAAVAYNNKIYAIGGYNADHLSIIEEYDIGLGRWTGRTGNMPTPRSRVGASLFKDPSDNITKILAVGGITSPGAVLINCDIITFNQPNILSYPSMETMLAPRCEHGLATVGNSVYAMGGYNSGGVLAACEEFIP